MIVQREKDLTLYATTDPSPANDEGVLCGGFPNDESTLIASDKDKPDGSMHQNFMGKFNVGFPQYDS